MFAHTSLPVHICLLCLLLLILLLFLCLFYLRQHGIIQLSVVSSTPPKARYHSPLWSHLPQPYYYRYQSTSSSHQLNAPFDVSGLGVRWRGTRRCTTGRRRTTGAAPPPCASPPSRASPSYACGHPVRPTGTTTLGRGTPLKYVGWRIIACAVCKYQGT